jgi:quercetin dioxygenase-like cupin family protein
MKVTPPEEAFAGAQRTPEPTGSPLLSFDLKSELQRLRTEDHPWQAGRNAKILVKYPNLRILLIGLRSGAHVAEHQAAGPVSIQVLSGHVLARAGGKVFELREGQLLALEAHVPHDVEALAESAVLVTIAWPGDERS